MCADAPLYFLQGVMQHQALLHHVMGECEKSAAAAHLPAQQASAVLSCLHSVLQEQGTVGTFSGNSETACNLNVSQMCQDVVLHLSGCSL